MYYPKFIKPNETIGISAPSKGVGLKLDEYKRSIKRLSKIFKIKGKYLPSISAIISLFLNAFSKYSLLSIYDTS